MAWNRRRRPASVSEPIGKSRTGDWIEVKGQVVRLLPDDLDGSRHQRIILDLRRNGQTLLIAHNVEVAERIPTGLGDRLSVRGIYEWNDLGGLLHWTHRDPMGIEEGGFVEHRRKRYC